MAIVPSVQSDIDEKPDAARKSLTFTGLVKVRDTSGVLILKENKTGFSFIKQSPLILFPFLDNFICFCGNGMIESMLEPHLKSAAGATQLQIGITFLILGGTYMVTTPLAGYVSWV